MQHGITHVCCHLCTTVPPPPLLSPQETKKIKEAGLDRDREQEVLAQLLHKETKLLQTIDRLKINANHENKDLRIQHTLGKMSQVGSACACRTVASRRCMTHCQRLCMS
jgi:hypothetical protein